MHSVSSVQAHWLRLLQAELAPGEVGCVEVEPGHLVVVLAVRRGAAKSPAADYHALESCLGRLEDTRAIYLDSSRDLAVDGTSNLRSWAGDLAAAVERGARRAFAVIRMEAFRERIREEFVGQGWSVESYGEDLKVSTGGFSELVNVAREAVRMVLGREDFAEATRFVREETGQRLARDAQFFTVFKSRFERFFPATLDHFFIAYPEASCVAAGWDYWQLAERPAEEAQAVFEEGIKEIELLLQTTREEGPAGLPAVTRCGHSEAN